MDFVSKVIMSCKTKDQLESCKKWVKELIIPGDYDVCAQFSIRLQYQSTIISMEQYLNKMSELGRKNESESK